MRYDGERLSHPKILLYTLGVEHFWHTIISYQSNPGGNRKKDQSPLS